jgi:hypothetical protein
MTKSRRTREDESRQDSEDESEDVAEERGKRAEAVPATSQRR